MSSRNRSKMVSSSGYCPVTGQNDIHVLGSILLGFSGNCIPSTSTLFSITIIFMFLAESLL